MSVLLKRKVSVCADTTAKNIHFLDFFREELTESMLITSFKCSIYAKCVSYHYVMYNIVLS